MNDDVVIRTARLKKTFAIGFFRRKVEAVRDVSFEVKRGEIFGFVGPNGAGKTTTIKMLMGLIFPDRGPDPGGVACELLGRKVPNLEARRRLGYLPEQPYFYEHLTGAELLDFTGRLFELPSQVRRERGRILLERVGISGAASRPLRKYSKGMLQRLGFAQALINDPELVVLDEPMSGLDPIGRKEMRDLIAGLRQEGKTVFFSTHILSDVELLCDRCAIIVGGTIRDVGPLDELLSPKLLSTDIVLAHDGVKEERRLVPGDGGDDDVDVFLDTARAAGKSIVSVTPRREHLEDLFVREVEADKARQ